MELNVTAKNKHGYTLAGVNGSTKLLDQIVDHELVQYFRSLEADAFKLFAKELWKSRELTQDGLKVTLRLAPRQEVDQLMEQLKTTLVKSREMRGR